MLKMKKEFYKFFSAGPSVLPLPVLEKSPKAKMLCYGTSGNERYGDESQIECLSRNI